MKMRQLTTALLTLVLLTCNRFADEAKGGAQAGAPIKIVDSNYVVVRPVYDTAMPGSVTSTVYGHDVWFLPSERILDLRNLDARTAKVSTSPDGTFMVWIETTPEGSKLLGAWTSANLQKHLGIFLDNRLVAAPRIKSKIDGMIVIEDEFTKAQAEAVVARLKRGGAAV
jgi:preprotein translocase subunit SecD